MKGKTIRHEVIDKTCASHIHTTKKRTPRLTPANKDLVPERVTLVAPLVPEASLSPL